LASSKSRTHAISTSTKFRKSSSLSTDTRS
jgi:hypothetical protein